MLKAKLLILAFASVWTLPACAGVTSRGPAALPFGQTASGIPLDSDWKAKEYDYARKYVVHPAWGIAHSERDYQMAKRLAQAEHIEIDFDVLFAAAFLHDLGGIGTFAKPGVDHAVQSVALAEPLLQSWGFPMNKWPQVKEMILGHTYYGPLPSSPQAFAFRDADIVDFLGVIGAARILSITEEPSQANGTLAPTVGILQTFATTMGNKCTLNACRVLASERTDELNKLLQTLSAETFNGSVL